MINFSWDPAKAKSNLKKHGISFEEARSVFYDEYALQFFDDQAMEELRQQKEDLENQQTDGSTDNQNNSADMTQKMRKQEALDGGYRFEFGSMFTPFSGTSAAVCIAAGAYTTLLANGKKPKKAIKKIINRKSRN